MQSRVILKDIKDPSEPLRRKVQNTSAKGRKREHKSRDWLEEQGYFVLRAAGSKGDWDLVALPYESLAKILLVQVKANKVPPKLRPGCHEYPDWWNLHYHVWKDYARAPLVIDARTGERLSG